MAESAEAYANELRQRVDRDHTRKLAGFYVDLQNGLVELPSRISTEEARQMLEVAQWAATVGRKFFIEGRGLHFAIDDAGHATFEELSEPDEDESEITRLA